MAQEEHGGGIAGQLHYWTYKFDASNPLMRIHLDTMLSSILVATGIVIFAVWLGRRLTDGAPTGAQNFMEYIVSFVDDTVKDNFPVHNPYIAPLALTVFVFVFLCNTLDILPAFLSDKIAGLFGLPHYRQVPTNDLNLPVAMAICVFLMTLYYEFKLKPLHFCKELLLEPFASMLISSKNIIVKLIGVILIPLNLILKLVEELAKPLSLSFRLFGNMFAGEVLFLLIAFMLLGNGIIGMAVGFFVGVGWSVFHMFIGLLQAFIFMVLTVVYLSVSHQPVEHE